MLTGLEPAHAPLSLTRRLMRVLRPVIQVSVLPVSNISHHHSYSRAVTAELIRNNDARSTAGYPQEPAKEPDGRETVALRLDENIENHAVLIDGAP